MGKLRKLIKRLLVIDYDPKKTPKLLKKKLVLVFMMIILAFVSLTGYVIYINVSKGDDYKKIVLDQQQHSNQDIPFKRGDILDANGTKLATSERVYNVILDAPDLLYGTESQVKKNKKATIDALEECFDIDPDSVKEILKEKPDKRYNIMKKDISYDQAQGFLKKKEEQKDAEIRGIWLEEDYLRSYPYGSLASDVLGFTAAGNVGNMGLEKQYNSTLNGVDGRRYGYRDENDFTQKVIMEPQNGNSIVTSIDLNLQSIVEKHILEFNKEHEDEVKEGPGSKNTGVIVMRPNTGEILAMASYPNYDLNHPQKLEEYFDEETNEKLKEDQDLKIELYNEIWKNFCVSDTFEPGSTAKPFTIAAGLESGALKGDETYTCPGYLDVAGTMIKCNKRSGHGTQTLKQAIANSCNVALMGAAAAIGPEEFSKYQHIFGFGEYTGIDLPGEADAGTLLYAAEDMQPADLATNSFGQNYNVTMIQLASAFCSLINGGNYYEPHFVTEIQDPDGMVVERYNPLLLRKTVTEETSTMLKDYMYSTVTEGTAKKAAVEGYAIGGKTGTAEKHPRGQGTNLVSFISYAPQENPEIMVYVVIDEPNVANQANSTLAIKLSQKIMEEAFPDMNITKMETN